MYFFYQMNYMCFLFAGIQAVAWSGVRRGGRYVTGQTRVGPGARGGPGVVK